jgi:formate dehydrogenase maturation protein FdhE
MTTIKEILSKAKCKICGNEDMNKFVLYFVMEAGTTNKYVSCEICNSTTKLVKTEDYLLEPHIDTAG